MTPDKATTRVRAEHESLRGYLGTALTDQERSNVLLVSFNQWDFTSGAMAETAVTLHEMHSRVNVALWSNHTPIHDVAWNTSSRVARILRSDSRDENLRRALIRSGIPSEGFVEPPIRRWSPKDGLPRFSDMSRSALRAVKYRGTDMGRSILQVHPYRSAPISDSYLWPRRLVQRAARSYAFVFDQVSRVISDESVSTVMVYNGRFLHDAAAAAAAESAGIPVLYYDTGGNQTDFDLTVEKTHDWKSLQARMLRMYRDWPESQRDSLGASWFEERVSHQDPSNALYVESQQSGVTVELPVSEVRVVYFSSSDDELVELGMNWGDYFGGQPEALSTLADECRKRAGYSLTVRSHPHKRMKPRQDLLDWLDAVNHAQPDLHLDPYSPVDSYALMRQADIIVTYGSTTGVEAAYAGKPVIVMGPSAYDELGCATRVHDADSLGSALDSRSPGAPGSAIPYGLMMRRRGFSYEHVSRSPDGLRVLAGVTLREASPLVLTISNVLGRLQRWYLTR